MTDAGYINATGTRIMPMTAGELAYIAIGPDFAIRGIRLSNRTTGKVYYSYNRTPPSATVNDGFVSPGLSLPLDVVEPPVAFTLFSEGAGQVEVEFSDERFSPFGAVGVQSLVTLSGDLVTLSGDVAANTQAIADLANAIQEASSSAEVAFAVGTGVRSVTLFGVNPNDEYLIYSIFHGYDRADTGQAGLITVTPPTGAAPRFYWGSPGGGSTAPNLSKDFYFPPWRITVNGSSIVITARTPNVASVIQTLVVMYRYVPA